MTNCAACSHPIARRILAHSHTNGKQLGTVRNCENTQSELVTGQQTSGFSLASSHVSQKGWEWMILIEDGRSINEGVRLQHCSPIGQRFIERIHFNCDENGAELWYEE